MRDIEEIKKNRRLMIIETTFVIVNATETTNEENTEEQVDYIIEKVHEIVEYYRSISPF